MDLDIIKVETDGQVDAFHELPFRIYTDDSPWTPPFRFEIETIFDPEKNEYFQKGTCERFLVERGGEVVGRFAVMAVPQRDRLLDPPMGGIGFVEMVEDQQVADAIIDFARDWNRQRGYEGMRGPVNFGENDTYWGLLVENFQSPPVYGMFYHPPYYQKLMERTGAEKLDDLWSYKKKFDDPIPDRMIRICERIESRPAVTFRPIDLSNIYRDAGYIRRIYNQAWVDQDILEREEDFTELSEETVQQMVEKLKPVIIPESVLIAFVEGDPASFIVCIPDLNEISGETKGKLRWWHYPKLYFFKRRARRLRALAFGTIPKYRKMGLEALIFARGMQMTAAAAPNLEYLEGAWVSEKNWLMHRSLEALGCKHHKTHRVYRWID
ncbi:MAG: hypothetical protein R3211_09880 [Balneolaceae bacterium]|nr:hypothetical protein [Balneolaceae bacterium]